MRYLLPYDEWLPWSIAFLPDGETLAVGTFFGKLLLLNTQEPRTDLMLTLMDDLDNPIYSLAVSPDGQWLAAGGYEKLQIWDLESLTLVHTIEGFEDFVTSCAFLGDSHRLASGFEDGTIRIEDTAGATPTTILDHHSDWVYDLCVSPDGTLLASGSRDRSAKLYDLKAGRCLHTLESHGYYVYAVPFSADGAWLATAQWDGSVGIWEAKTFREHRHIRAHSGVVQAAVFAPRSPVLITGGEDGLIRWWNPEVGECLNTYQAGSAVRRLCSSQDGNLLAVVTASGVGICKDVSPLP